MADSDNPSKKVYNVALSNYEQLVKAIPVNDVLRKLVTKQIINLSDKQEIKSEKSDVLQAELLLEKFILKRVTGGEDEVFFTFLEVLLETNKCNSLVEKIYAELDMPLPEPLTNKSPESCITDDTKETFEMDPKTSKLIEKIVLPRISAKWDTVAAFLEYSIPKINEIRCQHKGDPRQCCKMLLHDWFITGNGVKPKTWEKLAEVLSEINDIAAVTVQIKRDLRDEGVIR